MGDTDPCPGAPRKVLLATDLSARGDRALERAVAIARQHDTQIVIVHAVEAPGESKLAPEVVAMMKQRIAQELRADLGDVVERAAVHIEEGDPADVVERIAISEGVDLVVTGIAREGWLAARPVILGKTVEQLLRRLWVPILIVRNRARSAYRHIVVATDFSDTSAHALQAALRFFPVQPVHLLHASEAPYSMVVDDPDRYAESYREVRAAELGAFLESIFLPESDRQRLVTTIESGPPQPLIREYVETQGADLVVLGTRGRGAVLESLLGSTAKSILSTLPCDALVVRGPRQP